MKILLLGDASNYHNALGVGLSRLGHDVTVASHGSRWMDTRRDINLSRRPGKIGGALLYARLRTVLASRLKGYDVVQIVNPVFVELRPHRVGDIFRRLKRDNGMVCLTALGTDLAYMRMVLSPDNPLRYTEFAISGKPTPFALSPGGLKHRQWLEDPLLSHAEYVYEHVDGVVTALYEYQLAMERVLPPESVVYGGIPVDVDSIEFSCRRTPSPHLSVLAPYHAGRELEKGTDIMRRIAEGVPNIHLRPVTGLKFAEFQQCLKACDVVLDQYYSYTPATTALMAMAVGKTVVTGAEPDFEKFVGEQVPAVNVSPFDHDALRTFLETANDSEALYRRGKAARDFVRRNNDTAVVARRFLSFWQR